MKPMCISFIKQYTHFRKKDVLPLYVLHTKFKTSLMCNSN